MRLAKRLLVVAKAVAGGWQSGEGGKGVAVTRRLVGRCFGGRGTEAAGEELTVILKCMGGALLPQPSQGNTKLN